jgi:hypothetical protein
VQQLAEEAGIQQIFLRQRPRPRKLKLRDELDRAKLEILLLCLRVVPHLVVETDQGGAAEWRGWETRANK